MSAGAFGEWLVPASTDFAGPASWMSTVRPLAANVKRGYLFPAMRSQEMII